MKKLSTLLIAFLSFSLLNAQENVQVSVGASYTHQSFYELATNEITTIDNESWDIGFSVFGLQDAAIFVNESAASMGTENILIELNISDFQDPITDDDLTDRVLNGELDWSNGAFNSGRDLTNPFDYGWGQYNPALNSVTGNKIYVIELRDGTKKRLQILSLEGTNYNFKYADFDGSNVKEVNIDKAQFEGKHRVYFSFKDETVKDLEPNKWDLYFTRYSTPIDDGTGVFLDYVVTGVLSSQGMEIAEANGVDPFDAEEIDFQDDYESSLDIIGYDWKTLDFATFQWQVVEDRAYFVKTAIGEKYKLIFFDFEGSSSGVSSFEKTSLLSTTTTDIAQQENLFKVFPNPNNGSFIIDLRSVEKHQKGLANIFDLSGSMRWSSEINPNNKLQHIQVADHLGSGFYVLQLVLDGKSTYQKLVIKY